MPTANEEVLRVIQSLKALINVQELSIRELERRAGVGQGTFQRVFTGGKDVKLWHVYKILETLATPPLRFFLFVYSEPSPQPEEAAGLIEQMRRLGLGPDPSQASPLQPETISDDELDRRIDEGLRRYARLRGGNLLGPRPRKRRRAGSGKKSPRSRNPHRAPPRKPTDSG
jgi:hypothetical protein